MDRLTLPISLQHQHTRTFGIGRVIFNHYRVRDSRQDILDKNVIGCQFVVAVIGDTDLSASDCLEIPALSTACFYKPPPLNELMQMGWGYRLHPQDDY